MTKNLAYALDPAQTLSCLAAETHTLTKAGPGSGKTRVLAARAAFLIQERDVEPERLFVGTFTRKAAAEMVSRIAKATGLPPEKFEMIGTLDALAARLMRRHRPDLIANRTIADPADQRAIIAEAGLEWEGDLVEFISFWKQRLASPDSAAAMIRARGNDARLQAGVHLWRRYEEAMAAYGRLDLADLMRLLVLALEEDRGFAAKLIKLLRHGLVDEYQDVNSGQVRLLRNLFGVHTGNSLWAVGDWRQSIYGFRGSDVGYIENFDRDFHGARVYQLDRNYRSTRPVVAICRALIDGPIEAGRNGPPVAISEVRAPQAGGDGEIELLAAWMKRLHDRGVPWKEMASLLRRQEDVTAFATGLAAKGIPVGEADSCQIQMAAMMRLLLSGKSDAEAIRQAGSAFTQLRPRMGELAVMPPPMAAERMAALLGDGRPRDERRAWMRAGARLSGLKVGEIRTFKPEDGVNVETIHGSKGLEYEVVALPRFEAGILPARNTDPEEERRVAFVGASRAKTALLMTFRQGKVGSPLIADVVNNAPDWALSTTGAMPRPPERPALDL